VEGQASTLFLSLPGQDIRQPMSDIIVSRGLVKRFGALTAVDGIDFAVRQGECFGFLGPNGAGKTSTIRMITCVSPPTAGSLRVAGMDVRADGRRIKAALGVVPQDNNLDPDLTVWQNLIAYSRYFDIPSRAAARRTEEALAFLQLLDRRDELVDNLSGGMQRRLAIARSLLNEPAILVLDEPTTGLDPQARHLVWQKLRQLLGRGVTMLLSTHNMEEAAHLCDRIVIMHLGRILAEGTPAELVAHHVGDRVMELRLSEEEKREAMARLSSEDNLTLEDVEDVLFVLGLGSQSPIIASELQRYGDKVSVRGATLEDVFLRLTGRGLLE
jgi:lipooligosaccharide transport system ATP-binding protein